MESFSSLFDWRRKSENQQATSRRDESLWWTAKTTRWVNYWFSLFIFRSCNYLNALFCRRWGLLGVLRRSGDSLFDFQLRRKCIRVYLRLWLQKVLYATVDSGQFTVNRWTMTEWSMALQTLASTTGPTASQVAVKRETTCYNGWHSHFRQEEAALVPVAGARRWYCRIYCFESYN